MSIISAGTTVGTALVNTGDTTGTLQLQINGTTPAVTLNASGALGVGSTPGYGTSGQVLTSSGTAGAPAWATVAATSSIVGITGTIAQFNTAVSDADLAILGANTFTDTQIYSDQQTRRAMLIDCGFTFLDKGNSGTTTQTFDYTAGSHQRVTATGNHTISLSNPPPTGNLGELLVEYTNGGAFTLTWPTINWVLPAGTTSTSISTYLAANTGRTALQTSGVDFILLWTRDAGTTWYGKLA